MKCIEDEIPFELPEGWAWARLASLIELFITGPFGSALHKSDYVTDGIPLINPINIIDGKVIPVDKMQVSSETVKRLSSFKVATNDIVIARRGDMGRCAVVQLAQKGWLCGTGSFILRLPAVLCSEYFAVCLRSPYAVEHMSVNSIGNTMLNLNQTILKSILMPVPPCAEQNRIIKVIFDATHLLAKTAAHSEELAVCVAKAKAKILDLAIRGKLVPQDPNDEPASVLLERIRTEKEELIKRGKIKRNKKESVIFKGSDNSYYEKIGNDVTCIDDEILFDIPPTWNWCRLGTIGDWATGATPNRKNSEYFIGNIPWLKTGDLNDNYITYIPEHISEKALQQSSLRLNPTGSVLIAMYGATIGKLGILTFPATTNQACCACLPFGGIDNKYLFYYLMSQKSNFIYRGIGGAQSNISKEKIISTLFPLPPKEEQHMILSRIEKLMKLIRQFEELL